MEPSPPKPHPPQLQRQDAPPPPPPRTKFPGQTVASGSGFGSRPPTAARLPTSDLSQWYSPPISTYSNSTGSRSGLSGHSPNAPSLSPGDGRSPSGTASPETPFSSDVALTQEWEKSHSLNPSLSFPFQREQFSEEELLASEVLEDLLRSPQYSPGLVSPPIQPPIFAPDPVSTLCNPIPWHGGLAVQGQGHENSVVVGSGGWDAFAEPNGIEFSPAAELLADYFNKGGVGGITALDLGFTTTPSLFPDHLFEPEIVHESDTKFFLPNQKFCVGYLYPWHVPPLKTMSRYASLATESFLPSIPLIHSPSMVLSEMPVHTAFALTVTGAAFEPEGEQFSDEMLVEKRIFLVRAFNKPDNTFENKVAGVQSMILYQLLGLFHRDQHHRILSHTFHGALVQMFLELDLPTKISSTTLSPPLGLEGSSLTSAWKAWIQLETWRRITFIVCLADLETATIFKTSPLISFDSLTLDLPASDALWNANDAVEWQSRITSPPVAPCVNYVSAIRALLSPTTPLADSPEGIILSSLSRLSPFPLLILSRSLSFLQAKTEEAMKEVDPFRALLGGLGMFEDREQENRAVLANIKRGREVLRQLPGGEKRGGGEGWFENVMPTAAKASQGPAPSREAWEDEIPPRQQPVKRPETSTKEQVDRVAGLMGEEFPTLSVRGY